MPVPFIWLGAGLAALYAGVKYSDSHLGSISHIRGESDSAVLPVNGCIVSCGVFGIFNHCGIWNDGNIIELRGNGLIRGISPGRFLHQRSGEDIYVACDAQGQPLVGPGTKKRAVAQLYQYLEYDLIKNNCHKFVWQCISDINEPLTRFTELNYKMAGHFDCTINWQKALYT
ncbi:MAG: hypothetical protein ACI965_001958 [Paraglaciecola sp.]|jgi:hypothetical protein